MNFVQQVLVLLTDSRLQQSFSPIRNKMYTPLLLSFLKFPQEASVHTTILFPVDLI